MSPTLRRERALRLLLEARHFMTGPAGLIARVDAYLAVRGLTVCGRCRGAYRTRFDGQPHAHSCFDADAYVRKESA